MKQGGFVVMDEKRKNLLYKELLTENEKLITYASKIFLRKNKDRSLSTKDFKQDAKLLLWTCFETAKKPTKRNIHSLWKCCLFRHVNNSIRKQNTLKRSGTNVTIDNDAFKQLPFLFKKEDYKYCSNNNISLNRKFELEHLKYISDCFLGFIKEKYGEDNLKYNILIELLQPTKEFEDFSKKNSKNGIYTFRRMHLAKYFKKTPASITTGIKTLKENFYKWNIQEINSLSKLMEKEN